eukprot:GHUV01013773.1.p1 GENE.GHUV01013773.1~~GHUV01013773.1.p1  ORF type:complete len:244 (+),score=120.32 GHUV01013773.1:53-733(+)
MEGLQAEDKRIKKHLVWLQHQTEELQRLSQQAITSEVALQQVRNELQQLGSQQQQTTSRLEVVCSSTMELSQHATEADQQLAALNSRLASNTADLAKLAESVGNCLAAARADAAAAAAAAAGPSSYLSTLLAPAGAGTAAGSANGSIGGAAAAKRGTQWSAWDEQLAEYDDLVLRLHQKVNDIEGLQSTSPHKLRASTAGAASSRYLTQHRHTSPGRSLASGLRRY